MRETNVMRMHKLELLQGLLQNGWEVSRTLLQFYEKDGEKLVHKNFLQRPTSYYVCLTWAPLLFAKPGSLEKICHQQSDAYYQTLIVEKDLTAIAAIEDIPVSFPSWLEPGLEPELELLNSFGPKFNVGFQSKIFLYFVVGWASYPNLFSRGLPRSVSRELRAALLNSYERK